MTVEAAIYISDYDPSTVGDTTDPTEGGAQLSMVKQVQLNTWTAIAGAVNSSHTELNALDLTTGFGTAENSKALVVSPTGTLNASIITWSNLGIVTTADINGGTIDGTVIGGSTPAAGTFTNLTVTGTFSGTGGSIDSTPIGGTTPAAGAFTTLTASGAVTFVSGTINGTAIGGTTPAAGAFTTLTASGAITFTSGTLNGVTIGGTTPAAATFTTATAANNLSTGTLGFTTGAGGSVTQTTSRTTSVTINKACGSIQLFAAAGSTTWATFTVSNSTVAIGDTPIVVQRTGSNLYEIHVTKVDNGSFNISQRTTGGTTSEAPVFNFVVIKGVTA